MYTRFNSNFSNQETIVIYPTFIHKQIIFLITRNYHHLQQIISTIIEMEA